MWTVARVRGIGQRSESRAVTDLRRFGVRSFWPEEHRYFIHRKTKEEKHRVLSRFPGYIFVEFKNDADRFYVGSSMFVSYVLGGVMGERFVPARIADHYVTDLMDAGPLIVNKANSGGHLKHGQKAKLAFNACSEIIGEYRLDDSGKSVLRAQWLGSMRDIPVNPERLQAAE